MKPSAKADLLVGVQAIADFLGYTKAGIQHLIDRGAIPIFRIGARVHARPSTLNEWLAELDTKARAEAAVKADRPPL